MAYVSCPQIGRLALRTRRWAQKAVARGDFGPEAFRKGRARYFDLANVEAGLGCTFTAEQIERALCKQQDDHAQETNYRSPPKRRQGGRCRGHGEDKGA
jgi:hypothetical protein